MTHRLVYFIGGLMSLLPTASSQSVTVTYPSGEMRFPLESWCLNQSQPSSLTWNFPQIPFRFLFLAVKRFNISCTAGNMLVNSSSSTSTYCGNNDLKNSFYDHSVKVQFSTSSCVNEFRINYYYTNIRLAVEPDDLVISTNSLIFLKTVIFATSSNEVSGMNCELFLSNGTKLALASNKSRIQLVHDFPATYHYAIECTSASTTTKPTSEVEVNVEDSFSLASLQMNCFSCSGKYLSDLNVTFQHFYIFPVRYILAVRDIDLFSHTNRLDRNLYLNNSLTNVDFSLPVAHQAALGPGIHASSITLYNNVSTTRSFLSVTLNQALSDLSIICERYIGIFPNDFTINLSLKSGAPAEVSVTLYRGNTSVTEVITSCSNASHCSDFATEVQSPKSLGVYWIHAVATNGISSVNGTSGPVECVPKVYDVYLKVNNAFVGREVTVEAFVRGDFGEFFMNLFVDGKRFANSFKITSFNHTHNARLPFDGRKYTHVEQAIMFLKSGYRNLIISVNNTKQVFNFSTRSHVRSQQSCFQGINIRGGSTTTVFGPLDVGKYIILSTNTTISCLEETKVSYKWRLFKIKSLSSTPKTKNEITLKASHSELVFQRSDLEPGIYLIFVTVFEKGFSSAYPPLLEEEEFAIFKVGRKTLNMYIKGGKRREIGGTQTNVLLEALLENGAQGVWYDWFCTISRHDLPADPEIGKISRKGSCFDLQSAWIPENHTTLDINITTLTKSKNYFLRVFATASGYETIFDDQEIVVLPQEAPEVKLRCWSNCGKVTIAGEPLVLQLECSECSNRLWELKREGFVTTTICKDQEWCAIDLSIFKTTPRGSARVVATGVSDNAKASITFVVNFLSSPESICSVSPDLGYAFTTTFSFKCPYDAKDKNSLQYKFFILEKGKLETILQYTYASDVYDLVLAPEKGTHSASVVVEICNQFESCSRNVIKVQVIDLEPETDVSELIEANIKAENYQTLSNLIAFSSSRSLIKDEVRSKVVDAVSDFQISSAESAKLISDVLQHVTSAEVHLLKNKEVKI